MNPAAQFDFVLLVLLCVREAETTKDLQKAILAKV